MTSTDREILIAINGRVERIDNRVSALESTIAEMRRENDYRFHRIEDKIDNLQTSVYWALAAVGIFLAALAVIPSLTTRKPEPPKDDKIHLTLSQFGTLITDRLNEIRKGDQK